MTSWWNMPLVGSADASTLSRSRDVPAYARMSKATIQPDNSGLGLGNIWRGSSCTCPVHSLGSVGLLLPRLVFSKVPYMRLYVRINAPVCIDNAVASRLCDAHLGKPGRSPLQRSDLQRQRPKHKSRLYALTKLEMHGRLAAALREFQ